MIYVVEFPIAGSPCGWIAADKRSFISIVSKRINLLPSDSRVVFERTTARGLVERFNILSDRDFSLNGAGWLRNIVQAFGLDVPLYRSDYLFTGPCIYTTEQICEYEASIEWLDSKSDYLMVFDNKKDAISVLSDCRYWEGASGHIGRSLLADCLKNSERFIRTPESPYC